jgi:hypothetical protein
LLDNLDSVLPLHVASSGENYLRVKPLIEQGAYVKVSSRVSLIGYCCYYHYI